MTISTNKADTADAQLYMQTLLNRLIIRAKSKGFIKVECSIAIHPFEETCGFILSWQLEEGYVPYGSREAINSYKENLHDAYDEVLAELNEKPTIEQSKRTKLLELMARSVELGKELNLDVAVINPIIEQMKKISENAITHVKVPDFLKRAVPDVELVGDWSIELDTISPYIDTGDIPF